MAEEQLVAFRLGKEEYAVSISRVKEIIHYKPISFLQPKFSGNGTRSIKTLLEI